MVFLLAGMANWLVVPAMPASQGDASGDAEEPPAEGPQIQMVHDVPEFNAALLDHKRRHRRRPLARHQVHGEAGERGAGRPDGRARVSWRVVAHNLVLAQIYV